MGKCGSLGISLPEGVAGRLRKAQAAAVMDLKFVIPVDVKNSESACSRALEVCSAV